VRGRVARAVKLGWQGREYKELEMRRRKRRERMDMGIRNSYVTK